MIYSLYWVCGLPPSMVSVCAHDAGSAAHIAAWISSGLSQAKLCVGGPATRIFKEKLVYSTFQNLNLYEAIEGSQVLVTGTSWASDLEHQARLLARQMRVPSVAVLDHWGNYRERFQWDGQEVLPDALWVADAEAAALATSAFPNVPVVQLPNHWLEDLCNKARIIRSSGRGDQPSQPRRPARRLLYLLEPIRVPWSQSAAVASEAGEFQALRYWLRQLPYLIKKGWVAPKSDLEALALRPHPSEPDGKYNDLLGEASLVWPIQVDRSSTLAEALAWADMAFGCETQALVAAMACGLPAFSTVPPWAPPCRLPQASLHHLSRLEDA